MLYAHGFGLAVFLGRLADRWELVVSRHRSGGIELELGRFSVRLAPMRQVRS